MSETTSTPLTTNPSILTGVTVPWTSVKQHLSLPSSPQRFRNGRQAVKPSRSTSTSSPISTTTRLDSLFESCSRWRTAGLQSQQFADTQRLTPASSPQHPRKHGRRFECVHHKEAVTADPPSLTSPSPTQLPPSAGGRSHTPQTSRHSERSSYDSTPTTRSAEIKMSYRQATGSP